MNCISMRPIAFGVFYTVIHLHLCGFMTRYVQREELPMLLDRRDASLKAWVLHKLDEMQKTSKRPFTPDSPIYQPTSGEYIEWHDSTEVQMQFDLSNY